MVNAGGSLPVEKLNPFSPDTCRLHAFQSPTGDIDATTLPGLSAPKAV
jgi:hypothetical protein